MQAKAPTLIVIGERSAESCDRPVRRAPPAAAVCPHATACGVYSNFYKLPHPCLVCKQWQLGF